MLWGILFYFTFFTQKGDSETFTQSVYVEPPQTKLKTINAREQRNCQKSAYQKQ